MWIISLSHRLRRGALFVAVAMAASLLMLPMDEARAAPYPWDYGVRTDVVSLDVDHSPAPYAVDWNNDGLEDLVVGFRSASQYGGIGVYLRNSDGSLATTAVPAFTTGAPVFDGSRCTQLRTALGTLVGQTTVSSVAYVSPEVVDWDDGGDLDVLVGTGADAAEKGVRLYENTGTATASALAEAVGVVSKAATPGLASEAYYEPTVVDINDDGAKDLLIAEALLPWLTASSSCGSV
jgi:hypothetical protein